MWWEKNGWWIMLIVGAVATIIACIAAPFTCGASSAGVAIGVTIFKIALGTAVGAAVSLAIGGIVAGVQSSLTGHGFWNGFANSVQESAVDALIISFAFAAVSVAVNNFMQCFKEGTLVETEDGLKPIEEVEVGDKVLAYDEDTGKQDYKKVVRLFRNETNEWYHIHVNGEEIICTGGHPFYLANLDKFIPARELKLGDTLLLSDNTCVIIEEIQVERLSKPETTYNFEVEDFHTYYVTDSKILVHNKCPKPNIEKTVPEGYEPTYENGVYEPNPKHGKVPHGDVSKNISSVEYGQYALDKSVAAGSSRMSFNGKDFLIFKQHSPGVWHGYTTDFAGLVGRQIQMNVARTVFNVWR